MSALSLAKGVRDRRQEIGLGVLEAAHLAGIASSTWHKIEAGTNDRLTAPIARKLDDVLGWQPGTAAACFRDGDGEEQPFDFRYRHGETHAVLQAKTSEISSSERVALDELLNHMGDDQLIALRAVAVHLARLGRVERLLDDVRGYVVEIDDHVRGRTVGASS